MTTDWNAFADDTYSLTSDTFILSRSGGGVNLPANAFLRRVSNGNYSTGEGPGIANLNASGSFAVTAYSGPQCFLIGNQDTLGASGPAMIVSANGDFHFGHGNSWAPNANGGSFSAKMTIAPTGNVGVGTQSVPAKLSVLTNSGTGGSGISVWDNRYLIVGPNSNFANGGAIALSYNNTNNTAEITALSPGTAWRPLVVQCNEFIIALGGTETIKINNSGHYQPFADNAQFIGTAAKRMAVIYAGTGSINTSDEREKEDIGSIPDVWLDAWADVEWSRFRFKGRSRCHIGLVAQRVHAAFAAHGLDAFEIGLCCFDQWDERRVPEMTVNEAGEAAPTGKELLEQEAGDRWGLRYDECFAIEAAWQRRELTRLHALLAVNAGQQKGPADD
jgi:Chaperone of endosialidase